MLKSDLTDSCVENYKPSPNYFLACACMIFKLLLKKSDNITFIIIKTIALFVNKTLCQSQAVLPF